MTKICVQGNRLLSALIISFVLLLGMVAQNKVHANTPNAPQQAKGTQLAYFVGYHNNYRGYNRGYHRGYNRGYHNVYYGNRYYRASTYWSGWRYVGHGCRKSCLIDRRTGRVIRCKRRC